MPPRLNQLRRRVARLAKRCPAPPVVDNTPEARRAWCIEHGIDPDSLLLGWEHGGGIVVLPPQVDP